MHIYVKVSEGDNCQKMSENPSPLKKLSHEKKSTKSHKVELTPSRQAGELFFCLLMRVKVSDDDSEQKLKLTKTNSRCIFFQFRQIVVI